MFYRSPISSSFSFRLLLHEEEDKSFCHFNTTDALLLCSFMRVRNWQVRNPNNKERCLCVCLYGTDFSETCRPILMKLCMRNPHSLRMMLDQKNFDFENFFFFSQNFFFFFFYYPQIFFFFFFVPFFFFFFLVFFL